MARRTKPEVKCYHCDRDLQYELEAMRESVKRTIGQCHSLEKSNLKLEAELEKYRPAKWMIEAPDERFDLKPEDEE
jgi:hypothetical protein